MKFFKKISFITLILSFILNITFAIPNPYPSVLIKVGTPSPSGYPLTFKFHYDGSFSIKKLYWNEKSQAMDLEIEQLKKVIKAGETYNFDFLPDGDIPNLEFCFTPSFFHTECVKPEIFGNDGSFIIKNGLFAIDYR